jgi:hypothetical protein
MKPFKKLIFLVTLFGCLAGMLAEDATVKVSPDQSVEATTYQIRNKKYQELLRPENANGADGTRIVLYSPEPWKCMTWKVQAAAGMGYHFQNLFTSKTFAADADAVQTNPAVTQVPCHHDPDQSPVWHITKLDDGTYKIFDVKTAKVLTAVKESGGEKIVVAPWQNGDEQKWELLKMDPQQLTM